MVELYARWIDRWERDLATRDTNRVVRPFEWGLDWLGGLEFPALSDHRNDHAREALDRFAEEALGDSDRFFTYRVPADYQLRNGHLTFTSPVETPYPENNIVHAEWFPVERSPRRAVLVLPQWNAGVDGQTWAASQQRARHHAAAARRGKGQGQRGTAPVERGGEQMAADHTAAIERPERIRADRSGERAGR